MGGASQKCREAGGLSVVAGFREQPDFSSEEKGPSKMRTTESTPEMWQQSSDKRRPTEDTEPK